MCHVMYFMYTFAQKIGVLPVNHWQSVTKCLVCNSSDFGLMWVGFFAHHNLASGLRIQSSCRNVSLNALNF